MNKIKQAIGLVAVLGSIGLLAGCGTQVAGGGVPAPQPITPQSAGNGNTNGTGTTQPATSQSGGKTTDTATKTGQGTAGGQAKTAGSKSAATGSSTGNTSPSGTTGTTTTGQNAKNNKPVTVAVQGSTQLVATTVSDNGSGGTFIPVSSSITTVLLPANWTLETMQDGSEGTTIRLTNPKDSTQSIVELVQTSARNLTSFYNGQSAGAVHWIVPQQVAGYTFTNPQNPNPDRGIMANLSSGGSIRLDIYLPEAQKATAQQIINSFIHQSSSS